MQFTSYLLGIVCPPHDYAPVDDQIGLASLAERRCHIGSNFSKELLAGEVVSPTLLSLFNF